MLFFVMQKFFLINILNKILSYLLLTYATKST